MPPNDFDHLVEINLAAQEGLKRLVHLHKQSKARLLIAVHNAINRTSAHALGLEEAGEAINRDARLPQKFFYPKAIPQHV